jgi:hypothetical protein
MYLFTRTGRVRPGNIRESMAWAVAITEKVNQVTSLDVGLWTSVFSPASGTLAWSSIIENLVALEDANAKLMVDDGFIEQADRGAAFINDAGLDDEVGSFVHLGGQPTDDPKYVAVVRSELVPGGFAKGIEAGVQIAQRATEIGGQPTSFLVGTTGKYGGVAWITGTTTLQELEQAEQALNADASFVQLIDQVAPGVYLPGITTQTIWNRLA